MLNRGSELNRMLDELSQREQRVACLNTLLQEERARVETIQQTLDEATRPSLAPLPIPLSLRQITENQPPRRIHHPRGYAYAGKFYPCWSEIDIYLGILKHLFADYPDRHVALASAVHGRDRAFLAQSRESLFRGKDATWIARHSAPVANGWYADTNMNHRTKVVKLHRALAAVGLQIGEGSVKITWRGYFTA